jgi:hypothetical protein
MRRLYSLRLLVTNSGFEQLANDGKCLQGATPGCG